MGIIINCTFAHSILKMGRLIYIIISFLFLNIFVVLEYNTEVVQLVCRQNSLSYCKAKVYQLVAALEEDDIENLNSDFDFCKRETVCAVELNFRPQFNKKYNSFILFEADASPPLYI